MFGDGDDVGSRHLSDEDLLLVGRVEVDVIRAYAGGDASLEILGFCNDISGQIAGMERCAGDTSWSAEVV